MKNTGLRVGRLLEVGSTVVIAGVAVVMAYMYMQDRSLEAEPEQEDYESANVVPGWEEENEMGIRVGSAAAAVAEHQVADEDQAPAIPTAPRETD